MLIFFFAKVLSRSCHSFHLLFKLHLRPITTSRWRKIRNDSTFCSCRTSTETSLGMSNRRQDFSSLKFYWMVRQHPWHFLASNWLLINSNSHDRPPTFPNNAGLRKVCGHSDFELSDKFSFSLALCMVLFFGSLIFVIFRKLIS